MDKEGNLNTLKLKIVQICGIILRVWRSAMHTIQFCFGLEHLPRENSFFLCWQFYIGKSPIQKIFSGINFYWITDLKFLTFKTFGMQNGGPAHWEA